MPYYVRKDVIRRGLGVTTLDDYAIVSAERFFAAAEGSGRPHIADIAGGDDAADRRRPRPRAILRRRPPQGLDDAVEHNDSATTYNLTLDLT